MLEKIEFERWVRASHAMFETFEGRFDAYPLAVRWMDEWFRSKGFAVEIEHERRISSLLGSFDYGVYRVTGELRQTIDKQFESLVEKHLKKGRTENAGFAVSLYLFTWNFQRFKEYFRRRRDFDLELYFGKLGSFFGAEKEKLQGFRDKKLVYDDIEKAQVASIFERLNSQLKRLGINNNEPVGTAKLLHVCAPFYFPLIDNQIAKALGLLPPKGESLTRHLYLKWMEALKAWLQNYDIIENLEKEAQSSILKLVDEGLYVMSSINLRYRVNRLGLRVA